MRLVLLVVLILGAGALLLYGVGGPSGAPDAVAPPPRSATTPEAASAASGSRAPAPASGGLSGTVTWADGSPVPWARVHVMPDGDVAGESVVDADAAGRWAFAVYGDFERWGVVAQHGSRRSRAAEVPRAPQAPVHLRFENVPLVRGRLLGPDGEPVRGEVDAFTLDGEGPAERVCGLGRADGSFFVDVGEPGRYGLVARAPGLAHSPWETVVVSELGVVVDLRLGRTADLRGTVVYEDGRPCAGMHIEVAASNASALVAATGIDRLRTERGWVPMTTERLIGRLPTARSGGDGAFRLPGLPAEPRYDVTCSDLAFSAREAVVRNVLASGPPVRLVVRSRDRSAAATVRFFSHDGQPARVLEVIASTTGDEGRTEPATARRDPDDRSAVHLDDLVRGRDFTLLARIEGYGRAVFGPWRADAAAAEHRVGLPAPGTAVVTVVDGDGVPRQGVRVSGERQVGAYRDRRLRTSGADGACVFEQLTPGAWEFGVGRDKATWLPSVEVPGGGSVTLELRVP